MSDNQMKVQDLYKKIIELAKSGVIVLQADGDIVIWNNWLENRSGIKEADIQGLPLLEVVPELKGSRIERAIKKALEFNCPSVLSAKLIDASFPLYKDKITGKQEPARLVQSILIKPFDSDGVQHCVISIYDISSADLREKALRNQSIVLTNVVTELREKDYELDAIFNNTQNGILVFDQAGDVLSANPSARAMLELDEHAAPKVFDVIKTISASAFGVEDSEQLIKKQLPEKNAEKEMVAVTKSGQNFEVLLTSNMIHYENQPSRFFIFFSDITEKKRAEKKLHYMAKYDDLTSLHNRSAFLEIANHSVNNHRRTNSSLNIFFIDIDRFKNVNDKLGHESGDKILIKFAARLLSCCRENDVIARWAGDEFVILMEHQNQNRSALTVAEKILSCSGQSININSQEIRVHCSIGISQFPDDGADAETLIANADQAMYQAKAEGKNQFRFFTPKMNAKMQERLQTETELMLAIKKEQFDLFYQPQVSVTSGLLCGVEALIRWNHPCKGTVLPDKFIPIAEESGLITEIGDWVLKSAIEMAANWFKREGETLPMSINLSSRQFSDEFLVTKLKRLIDSFGVPAESIIVEITENHLMGETHSSLVMLNSLKALGVRIAIDDFGTGYSSLAYLRTLPVDIIKIDREFLSDAIENKSSAHIISAIIELSHALNLEVVAEGIEERDQLELLRSEGCDKAQGFYLGTPMELDNLKKWVSSPVAQTMFTH